MSSSPSSLLSSIRRSFSISSSSSSIDLSSITSLTDACNTGRLDFVQKAIENRYLPTPETLTAACKTREIAIVDLVIEAGATANEQTLTEACATGIAEIVRRVLKKGAKATPETIQTANGSQNRIILELLEIAPRSTRSRQSSKTQEEEPSNDLTMACSAGNLIGVTTAIAKGIPPQKSTLLRGAESGSIEIIEQLHRAGAKPHEGPSELSAAFRFGSPAIAKKLKLLFPEIKPDEKTLSEAFASGDLEGVDLALECGAKPDGDTLNRALVGFLTKNPKKTIAAIDKAISAGACSNEKTFDLALRHLGEFGSPEDLVSLLCQKTQARLSPQSLTLACKWEHSDHLIYNSFLLYLLKMGAKPDGETFSSIRWTGTSPQAPGQFYLYTDTINAFFRSELTPTQSEIDSLKSKIVETTPKTSRRKSTVVMDPQIEQNTFYRKVVEKAENALSSSLSTDQ